MNAVPVRMQLPPKLDDPQSFDKIVSWIARCDGYHEKCEQSAIPELPSRVLFVSSASDVSHLRLHINAGGDRARYVALSHCWGDRSTVPETTQGVVDQFTQNVPLNVLSKNSQDAIRITQRLGYQYLWIDALYIIQDSAEDWAAEAAKMWKVYGGADLTIAIGSSRDGKGGCSYERQVGREERLQAARDLGTKMFVRFPRNHEEQIHSRGNKPSKNQLPLTLRKWCYQERMMSRRIV